MIKKDVEWFTPLKMGDGATGWDQPTRDRVAQLPGGMYMVRGSWDLCAAAIDQATRSGRLVAASRFQPDTAAPGMYLVKLRLVNYRRPARSVEPWYRAHPGRVVAAAVAGLGVLGLAGWAVSVVIPVLPEVGRFLLGCIAAVFLLWLAAGQVGACPGIHCPGCKCGGK